MPTPPSLTDEQRKSALAKSLSMRSARAQLKRDLAEGKVSMAEVLDPKIRLDPVYGRTQVIQLIRCLPGYGVKKASAVMSQLGISEARRLSGLGDNQIERLLERFK